MVKIIDKSHKNIFSVKGKVISIIGATGILGTQYVKYLSGLGATVVIGDVEYNRCVELSKKVNSLGYKTIPLEIDNTDETSINNFFKKIMKQYKRIDVLINNAQIKPVGFYATFENYSKETLMEVVDGNLIGVTLACREACGVFMNQKNGGIIVNIASTYGMVAPDQRIYDGVKNIYYPDQRFSSPVSYAISKAGVVQLTKYLASYYREKNIRINCLSPGGVFDNHDDLFNEQYSHRTTLGRMADKNEYNGAILFLCSDASNYMSGANLIVDGGWTAV